ncbi:MAG: glycoside hydrolase family 127 protein [Saccharofermentans sp.]|nr:glycoside hydrolase family 127 protein [Saccharofermentans sp.]
MPDSVERKNVKVTGGVFRERMDLNRAYLMELDTTCLLQNFYIEAGIGLPGIQAVSDPSAAKLHWGWEAPVCQLRGHFLGHWLSAASRLIASENDEELKLKLDKIVSEISRCQQRNGGEWTGPIPEKYFDLMAEPDYIWSPQYTMHKTVMGLVDAYRFAGNKTALEILDKLADWYIKWVARMIKKDPRITYKGEQGGMLEMWAELYSITGNYKYQALIDLYKDSGLFSQLERGSDGLSDDHANASIPLIHGAARMYEITGDRYWKNITDLFWKTAVTDRGMFATTGVNAGEFWIPLKSMGSYISDRNQEFCTVYNMVRVADYLYRRTGDTRYADYIERAIYNGFLAQQNKNTGMPSYFLPLNPGAKKKWGSKRHDFWCCHGTMVQAQTLYPELIYYTEDDKISVMQYIPSCAKFEIGGSEVTICQSTEMKDYNNQVFFDDHKGGDKSRWSLKFTVKCPVSTHVTLLLRVPGWCDEVRSLVINGEDLKPDIKDNLIRIAREWKDDTVYVAFADHIEMERLPGMPELAAAVEGPVVLAGLTGKDCGLDGDYSEPDKIFAPRSEHMYSTYTWKQNCHTTRMQPVNIEFIPLYEVTDEEYTVYFTEKKKKD